MAAEQPKKPAGGAFGQYMKQNRPALLKECAGKPATESIKLGSARYKALDASSRARFEKMYEQAKTQYAKDLAAFTAAGGEMKARKSKKDKEPKEGKKGKVAKDPNRPKKPAGGAFGSYLAKNRPEFAKECAGKPAVAVTKLGAERWKTLSDAAKVPFEKDYKAKQEAYAKAMKDYVPPAGAADEEDDGEEEGDEDADEDCESAEEEKAVPKKRKADANDSATAAKKGKTMEVPAEVLAEAKTLGFVSKLKALSENPNVKYPPSEILAKLQEHKGSVVAVRKAMLGA